MRSATPFGAIFGTLYGLSAAILVGFWDVITGLEPLSFQWITLTALTVNILTGVSLSQLRTRGRLTLEVIAWSILAAIPITLTFALTFSLRLVEIG